MTYASQAPGPALAWSRIRKSVEIVGAIGLVVLLLGTGFSKAAQNIGMALALLAFLTGLCWTHRHEWWPVISRDWLFRLTVLWVVYVVVLALVMARLYPEAAADHHDFAWKLSRLFLIVLVGWWTHISFKTPLTAYWLVLGGVAMGLVLFHHDLGWPIVGMESRRLTFWENAQFYGLLTGASLLLLGLTASAFLGNRASPLVYFRGLLWLAVTGLALNAFMLSQPRGALLGLVAALIALGALMTAESINKRRFSRRQAKISGLLCLFLLGGLWLSAHHAQDRIEKDVAAITQAFEDPAEIPVSNMGIRLYQWQAAAPLILEKPLFGWGPGAGSYLHDVVDLPDEYRAAGSHFHNTLLDLLLWLGLSGVGILLIFLFTWMKAASLSLQEHKFIRRAGLSAIAVFVLFAVASMTQTFLTTQMTWYFLGAFLGPVCCIHFRRQSVRHGRIRQP